MKKHPLILTVIASALFMGTSAYPQSTPTPTPTPGSKWDCAASSQNTELYGFCGKKDSVAEKVAGLPTEIVQRRVFVQITQAKGGEVKLFERKENNKFTVTTWKREDTFKLLPKIDTAVFENKGRHCVGERVVKELQGDLKHGEPPKVQQDVPVTSPEVFKESVQSTDGDDGETVKTTVWILC
jgi:hypothetical protein